MPAALKKPQDHRAPDGSPDTTYTHTFPDGGEVTLPRMDYLPFGVARKTRNLPEAEQMFVLVESLCDEDQLAVLDAQNGNDIGDMFDAWLKGSGIDPGGIRGLVELIDEHPDAIAHECIRQGVRLRTVGTTALSWDDLRVIVAEAPADSAIARATDPDWQPWADTSARLLHSIEHSLRVMTWQLGSGKRHDYPVPLPAPWLVDDEREVRTFGSDPVPLTELDAFLGWDAA